MLNDQAPLCVINSPAIHYTEPRRIPGGITCYLPISSRTEITLYNFDSLLCHIFCNTYRYIPISLRTKVFIRSVDTYLSNYISIVIKNAWYFKISLRTKIIFQYV